MDSTTPSSAASTKCCPKCLAEKPVEAFAVARARRDGRQSWCRACISEKQRAKRISDPSSVTAKREYTTRWLAENAAKNRQTRAIWRAKNRDKIRRSNRAAYRADVEAARAAKRADYRRHLNKRIAASSDWSKRNQGRKTAYTQKRRAMIAGVPSLLTPGQWSDVLAASLGICAYCNRKARLTLDHVEPISAGGRHEVGNIAAACRACNSSKNDSALIVWLARRTAA